MGSYDNSRRGAEVGYGCVLIEVVGEIEVGINGGSMEKEVANAIVTVPVLCALRGSA